MLYQRGNGTRKSAAVWPGDGRREKPRKFSRNDAQPFRGIIAPRNCPRAGIRLRGREGIIRQSVLEVMVAAARP